MMTIFWWWLQPGGCELSKRKSIDSVFHQRASQTTAAGRKNCFSAPKFHLRMSIWRSGLALARRRKKRPSVSPLPCSSGDERDARVEVPADDEDALLRRLHRRGDDAVIIGGVDDHAGVGGAGDAPAIAPLRDDRGQLVGAHSRLVPRVVAEAS